MTSRYRAGADFERKVRDHLLANGAIHVVRSAGSKGPCDLIAFYGVRRTYADDPFHFGPERIDFVQCKRNGQISPADRWALHELATQCGAIPILAKQGPRGTPVVLERVEQKAAA